MSITTLIDPEATARFLDLGAEPASPRDCLLPFASLGRGLLNRLVHPAGRFLGDERVFYRPALRRLLPLGTRPILVRVDDYPRADLPTARFYEFAQVLADHGIQFLLGVTPLMPRGKKGSGLTDEELGWLMDATASDRVRLAVHGTTHANLRPDGGRHATTELVGEPPDRLRASISRGFEALVHAGLPRPLHYIPPFNSIDERACVTLSETYPYLHGGPLSFDTLGPVAPGVVLAKAAWFPCFMPFYARARELVSRVAREPLSGSEAAMQRPRYPQVLTLHWAWEQEDELRGLRHLAVELAGRAGRWQEWERFGATWMSDAATGAA